MLTEGLVLDAVGEPIVGTLVVVTDSQAAVIAIAVTGDEGDFCVQLPVAPDLELALPKMGVAGIPVEPGNPILIIVR
jgi:hypothetical protein